MLESSQIDMRGLNERIAAIDFGASNTDAAAVVDGKLHVWTEWRKGLPSIESVEAILASGGVDVTAVQRLAVTGGHHQLLPDYLPDSLGSVAIVKVGELQAIGRGGQALASGTWRKMDEPLLVVSAGSGTALVVARGDHYQHATGTGVGGGTLLGLGRLLLATTDPVEIDRLAKKGDPNVADLALRDLVSGPIGTLPADATAVNFGRIASLEEVPGREDLAAALVNMLGQVIATLATNAARAAQVQRGVVIGHMTDMDTMRVTMARVGEFFGFPVETCREAGYGTVIGALLCAVEK